MDIGFIVVMGLLPFGAAATLGFAMLVNEIRERRERNKWRLVINEGMCRSRRRSS